MAGEGNQLTDFSRLVGWRQRAIESTKPPVEGATLEAPPEGPPEDPAEDAAGGQNNAIWLHFAVKDYGETAEFGTIYETGELKKIRNIGL